MSFFKNLFGTTETAAATAPAATTTAATAGMKVGKRGLPVAKKADRTLGQSYISRPVTRSLGGTTHLLICALDYKSGVPKCPLTCTHDGKNMYALAQASGITDIEYMQNEQCSKEAMIAALIRTAKKCSPGDTFLFFFAGHGMGSTDYDGDEPDGKDENYVCDFSGQQMNPDKHFLSDDDFAKILTSNIDKAVDIFVVSDCCHSGSMCDFNRMCWNGFNAVSISGCRDSQTSGDTGKGGICTHSIMLAVEQLQKEGNASYDLSKLYRKTVYFDDTMMNSAQDIQFDSAPGTDPKAMTWPLIPKGPFTAPYNTASGLLAGAGAVASTPAAAPVAAPVAAPAAFTYAPAPAAAPAPMYTQGGTTFLPPMTISAAPVTTFSGSTATAPVTAGEYPGMFASMAPAKPMPVAAPAPTYTYASAPAAAPAFQYAPAPVAAPAVQYAAAPVAAPATATTGAFGGWL
mmetsp:Transcript_106408/g.200372  ORF Transcript_106408/g.200372 Transcript_106408/m.200372 type:complete len:459 (-) Transcript_106408:55-1431(-)